MEKILFIMNVGSENSLPAGISGGEVRLIEVAKQMKRKGLKIHVYTSKAGEILCKRFGLDAIFHEMRDPGGVSILSFGLRSLYALFLSSLPKGLESFDGIIYTSCDEMYDTLPAVRIKRKNPEAILVVSVHWLAPLKRERKNLIRALLFYINQRVGLFFAKRYADSFFAVSKPTAESLVKANFPKDKIFPVKAGVEFNNIRKISTRSTKKEFDAIFMKRLESTKGIFDLIDIWRLVVDKKPGAKLAIVGHGSEDVIDLLKERISEHKLKNNIVLFGPIYNFDKKFSIVNKSKLFILPSYEENWAIVIGEAMAAGLPIICYNLPDIKPIWKDSVVWVKKGDTKRFAQTIVDLLKNVQIKRRLSRRGVNFVRSFSWDQVAIEELKILQSLEDRE